MSEIFDMTDVFAVIDEQIQDIELRHLHAIANKLEDWKKEWEAQLRCLRELREKFEKMDS